ncbi:MAG: DPP IV N-terminal domain-containing protein [Prevotella sp.]
MISILMTTKKIFVTLVTLLSIMTTTTSMAQGQKLLTLEELNFGGVNYRKFVPERLYSTWWGEQLMYQDVEETGMIDMKSGERRKLFSLDDVNPRLDAAISKLDGFKDEKIRTLQYVTFPYPNETLALISNGHIRLLYDWKKGEVAWVQPCKDESETHWNEKSRISAFVKDNQLCITDAEGKTRQITTDGSREIVYGQAVHRNEFGIEEGIFWAPDGNRFAFYRMDQSMVTDYPQVNTFERVATHEPDKYPMLGMTSHKVTVGVYDCTSGKVQYLNAGDPTDRYFTNIAWAPDSKTVYMFELNRLQNDCRLVSYDATTGDRLKELYRETSEKYVEPLHPIVFLPWDKSQFIMQSQKDGYNHLIIYNIGTGKTRQLTSGKFVVEELCGFNEKAKSVIIASNEANPIQRNIYAVDVKSGKRKSLDNARGYHFAMPSKSGQWLVDVYSEPDVPRNYDLVATATGKSTRLLTSKNPWEGYQQPIFESGTIKADDGTTDLYWRMVKPADFDPTKKYPTVVYVYGGPHAHNVDATWHWGSRSWETYMAQKGYVLFILDNRGSENRGLEFEQATWHRLGKVEMLDQMKGVEYLKSLPYVDADRLGVHGWSYGGYMTISLMTNYPDVFKVGVAGGPVIDWRWYEVMYGERYMGTPETNKDGIDACSLIPMAKNLKGKLQIIIGMNDPTVVPQHALSFLNACTEAGTQPDFFVYPGEGHNMRGHKSVHLHERITQYFEDYLKY